MSNPLPKNWVEVPIGEIAHINPPLDRCLLDENTEITFLGMSSVLPEHRGISEPGLRPYREVSKGYTRFVEGDVLVAKITPCMENGKVVVAAPLTNTIGCGSTEFHVFRPRPGIDPGWISRFLWRSDIRHLAKTHMTGAVGQQRVPTGFFEDLTIPVPSTSEQRRIIPVLGDTLAKIDEAEEALERVKRNLDRYRASVLKAACEGRLVPTEAELARQENRDYEPASELLKRILIARREAWEKAQLEAYAKKDKTPPKDWKSRYQEPQAPDISDLPKLPEGWCWVSATQICAQVVDCHNKTAPYSGQGIPLIRTTNIRGGKIDLQQTKFVTETTYNHWSRRCPPEPGDILFTREAPMGEAGIIPDGARLCMGQRMMLLRASEGILNHYLLIALGSPDMMNHIFQNSIGTGVKHLRVRDVEGLPIPLPPFAEQQEIVSEVERLISVHGELERFVAVNRQRCHTLRQSLLKHAFSGKLVPQDPADEPASVLLERIRAQRLELKGGTTPRKRVVRKTEKTS